ncbi:flagellar biosynthesis anti-sigma factor FlgM [Colwellia sp. MEBiC06753]
MAININNLNNNGQVTRSLQQQNSDVKNKSSQAAASAAHSTKVSQDSVSLTPQAKQLNELQKKNGDAPEVNQKKIEQLKKAIQSGAYKVDPEKLAESIAKFEFDLI